MDPVTPPRTPEDILRYNNELVPVVVDRLEQRLFDADLLPQFRDAYPDGRTLQDVLNDVPLIPPTLYLTPLGPAVGFTHLNALYRHAWALLEHAGLMYDIRNSILYIHHLDPVLRDPAMQDLLREVRHVVVHPHVIEDGFEGRVRMNAEDALQGRDFQGLRLTDEVHRHTKRGRIFEELIRPIGMEWPTDPPRNAYPLDTPIRGRGRLPLKYRMYPAVGNLPNYLQRLEGRGAQLHNDDFVERVIGDVAHTGMSWAESLGRRGVYPPFSGSGPGGIR